MAHASLKLQLLIWEGLDGKPELLLSPANLKHDWVKRTRHDRIAPEGSWC